MYWSVWLVRPTHHEYNNAMSPEDEVCRALDELGIPYTRVAHPSVYTVAQARPYAIYRGEVHGVTDNLDVRALIADWMRDRFDGKPLESRIVLMDCRTGMEIPG